MCPPSPNLFGGGGVVLYSISVTLIVVSDLNNGTIALFIVGVA